MVRPQEAVAGRSEDGCPRKDERRRGRGMTRSSSQCQTAQSRSPSGFMGGQSSGNMAAFCWCCCGDEAFVLMETQRVISAESAEVRKSRETQREVTRTTHPGTLSAFTSLYGHFTNQTINQSCATALLSLLVNKSTSNRQPATGCPQSSDVAKMV